MKYICLTEMELRAEGVEVTQQDWKPPVYVVASAVAVQTRLGQDAAVKPSAHTCSADTWLLASLWPRIVWLVALKRADMRIGEY